MIEETNGDQIENESLVVSGISGPRASGNKRKFSPEERGLFYFTTCEEIFML